jgi:hypothetical protein
MKNIILSFVCVCCLSGFSFGGDCTSGFCSRPSGRILSSAKTITKEVVRVPRRIVSGCVNGKCHRGR